MDIKRIDFKVSYTCNNMCLFCAQGDKREYQDSRSFEQAKLDLEESIQTHNQITFTGGEPTIQKHFLDLVQYAAQVGFKHIQIQTNGRMFAKLDFCKQVIDAGATDFSLALHGCTPLQHELQTKAKGSFMQTVRGIQNLRSLNQWVSTNSVITRYNFLQLPDIAKLLVKLDVKQSQFAMIHPCGSSTNNFLHITPRFIRVKPQVHKAIDIMHAAGITVMTEAIPYCFMQGYEQYIAETIIPPTKVFDGPTVISDFTNYRVHEGKAKGPPCKHCIKNDVCEGPWHEYPDGYGWSEFEPIIE